MIDKKAQLFLTQAAGYLTEDKHARNFARRVKVDGWIKEFVKQLSEAGSDKVQPLTVAVVGEFKAGKSTLINALLKREVAFVDPFEATTSVAIIKPGANEKVVVADSSGKQRTMSIERFVDACRLFQMRDVSRVEMTVNHDLPAILIDTPGMGSITTAHEERAEAAIMDSADLVWWLMDPSDMLSAKEGAFLKRAQSINLPVWCIISKADELSDSDIEECVDAIVRTTGFNSENVLALSAHNYMESGSDAGVTELLKRLREASQRGVEVRSQAEDAKMAELLDEFRNAVSMVKDSLDEDVDWIDGERELFSQEAMIVKSTIIRDTKSFLSTSIADFFTQRLPGLAASGASAEHICRTLVEDFAAQRLRSVTDQIAQRVHQKAKTVWDESFEDRHSDLSRQIESIARNEMQDADSERFLREQLLVTRERHEAVRSGFGAVPAALGAGALTLLFDPTGITANLVTMAIGALAGHAAGKSLEGVSINTTKETEIQGRAVSDFARQMSDALVDNLFADEIQTYIDRIVEQALDERCRQRVFGMSQIEIKSLEANLLQITRGIDGIIHRGSPGDSTLELPVASGDDGDNHPPPTESHGQFADEVRVQLLEIVREYGIEIYKSPKRVEALLKDLCHNYPREIFLLTQCLVSGVFDRIIKQHKVVPMQSLIRAAANELNKTRGIECDAAVWAVESWSQTIDKSS